MLLPQTERRSLVRSVALLNLAAGLSSRREHECLALTSDTTSRREPEERLPRRAGAGFESALSSEPLVHRVGEALDSLLVERRDRDLLCPAAAVSNDQLCSVGRCKSRHGDEDDNDHQDHRSVEHQKCHQEEN